MLKKNILVNSNQRNSFHTAKKRDIARLFHEMVQEESENLAYLEFQKKLVYKNNECAVEGCDRLSNFVCSGCDIAFYCSVEHKNIDRKFHQKICKADWTSFLKCPLTGKFFIDPVQNKNCNHVYESESIHKILKEAPKNICKCPYFKCNKLVMEENLKETYFTKFLVYHFLVIVEKAKSCAFQRNLAQTYKLHSQIKLFSDISHVQHLLKEYEANNSGASSKSNNNYFDYNDYEPLGFNRLMYIGNDKFPRREKFMKYSQSVQMESVKTHFLLQNNIDRMNYKNYRMVIYGREILNLNKTCGELGIIEGETIYLFNSKGTLTSLVNSQRREAIEEEQIYLDALKKEKEFHRGIITKLIEENENLIKENKKIERFISKQGKVPLKQRFRF